MRKIKQKCIICRNGSLTEMEAKVAPFLIERMYDGNEKKLLYMVQQVIMIGPKRIRKRSWKITIIKFFIFLKNILKCNQMRLIMILIGKFY